MRKFGVFTSAGALAAAVWLAPVAAPRAESDLALDNLSFTVGATVYRIPHLELKGAAISAGDIAALFTGDEKAIDGRLARFSAKSLVIPSLIAERKAGDALERSAYKDVAAEDIAGGHIARLRMSGAEQTVERPAGARLYVWGAGQAKGVDLRQLLRLATAARVDPNEAPKPVIEEESVESLKLEDKATGLTATTGRLTLAGVKARALPSPPEQLLARLAALDPEKAEADPTLPKDLIEALASFEATAVELRDLAATGRGEPANKPFTIKLGRLAAQGVARASMGEVALERFALTASDGGVISLERFGLRDARLASLVENPFPLVGHVEFKGLAVDAPDARLGEASRLKFSLAGVEADFSEFREIAPSKVAARLDGLAIDLAARGEAPESAQFLTLGYRSLDFSAALSGEWREKTQEAVFSPVRVEGKDMGAVTMDVAFGNVSGAVFSSIPIVSKAAALAASVNSVTLAIDGGGLIDRMLSLEAKAEKKPLEKARAEYARGAAAAVTALGGGGEKAKKLGEAVAAYVMTPKHLHVRLSSGKGINALDLLARKPADVLEGLEVEASAGR